jgi:hypothetical protein
MAELDYAFVAEYAKVEAGKLTVVGASFSDIRPPSLPLHHLLFIAGRVRAPEDAETIGIRVRINPPGSNVNVVVDGTVTVGDDAARYDGKVGFCSQPESRSRWRPRDFAKFSWISTKLSSADWRSKSSPHSNERDHLRPLPAPDGSAWNHACRYRTSPTVLL